MPQNIGTRARQINKLERIDQGHETRSHTRDLGMTKLVQATSLTFVGGATKQIQAANGTFAAFAAGDDVLVDGVNLNNGFFHVTAIDATNQSYLVVDPPPAAEGPVTGNVRTP